MKIDVNMRTIAGKRRNKYEIKLSMPHAFERLNQALEMNFMMIFKLITCIVREASTWKTMKRITKLELSKFSCSFATSEAVSATNDSWKLVKCDSARYTRRKIDSNPWKFSMRSNFQQTFVEECKQKHKRLIIKSKTLCTGTREDWVERRRKSNTCVVEKKTVASWRKEGKNKLLQNVLKVVKL